MHAAYASLLALQKQSRYVTSTLITNRGTEMADNVSQVLTYSVNVSFRSGGIGSSQLRAIFQSCCTSDLPTIVSGQRSPSGSKTLATVDRTTLLVQVSGKFIFGTLTQRVSPFGAHWSPNTLVSLLIRSNSCSCRFNVRRIDGTLEDHLLRSKPPDASRLKSSRTVTVSSSVVDEPTTMSSIYALQSTVAAALGKRDPSSA